MAARRGREVPLARRQLTHEPVKLALALGGVTLAVALVGLLFGLREGIGRQVTTYADHAGADVYVAAPESSSLVTAGPPALDARLADEVRGVSGVADAGAIIAQLGVLRLHDKKVATLVVGFDRGRPGGPWELAEGRAPQAGREIAVDRVMADAHDLELGDPVTVRGRRVRVVGLTAKTASWMTPLVFVPRVVAGELQGRRDAASFVIARADGISPDALAERLRSQLEGVNVLTKRELARNDRELMAASFNAPLLVMVLIALAVGALVIAITTYGFVAERRREFGSLKAIGARNARLYRVVSVQAVAIALVGLAAGIALREGAGAAIESIWPKFLFVSLPGHYVLTLVAALVMGLVGALVPARVIARLDPAEVFRR